VKPKILRPVDAAYRCCHLSSTFKHLSGHYLNTAEIVWRCTCPKMYEKAWHGREDEIDDRYGKFVIIGDINFCRSCPGWDPGE